MDNDREKWEKSPPDSVGYWLRISVTGKPKIHPVMKTDGKLMILWGCNEEGGFISVDHSKIKPWWWRKFELPEGVDPNVVWEISNQRIENSNSNKPCITCNGIGTREMDIGDSNDVEVTCDDCHGTGVDQ